MNIKTVKIILALIAVAIIGRPIYLAGTAIGHWFGHAVLGY